MLLDIAFKIEEAASKGRVAISVTLESSAKEEVISRIRAMGYKIEVDKGETIMSVTISWEE